MSNVQRALWMLLVILCGLTMVGCAQPRGSIASGALDPDIPIGRIQPTTTKEPADKATLLATAAAKDGYYYELWGTPTLTYGWHRIDVSGYYKTHSEAEAAGKAAILVKQKEYEDPWDSFPQYQFWLKVIPWKDRPGHEEPPKRTAPQT